MNKFEYIKALEHFAELFLEMKKIQAEIKEAGWADPIGIDLISKGNEVLLSSHGDCLEYTKEKNFWHDETSMFRGTYINELFFHRYLRTEGEQTDEEE